MNAVESVPIPAQSLRRSSWGRRAAVVVLWAIVGVAAMLMAASAGSPPATQDDPPLVTRFGPAVDSVVRTNHLLEEAQAALASARASRASASVVTDLQGDVSSLQRDYAVAIEAMAAASRAR
jgi:hypothetical protein